LNACICGADQPIQLALVGLIIGVAFCPDHAVEGGAITFCKGPAIPHPLDQVWVRDVRGTKSDQVVIAVLQLSLCQLNVGTEVEDGLVSTSLIQQLKDRGHEVTPIEMTSGTQVIVRDGTGWAAGADPRREGTALGD
tara:strand:+ start:1383 stop:1793 length:411 start_codon:yes stop_codon:yes gene_type:complete